MVKVLFDACVPRRLWKYMSEFDIDSAQEAGLDQVPDGSVLDAIEGSYDVLVTRDRNLVFQQRIAGRSIAIVIVRSIDQCSESDAWFPSVRPEP